MGARDKERYWRWGNRCCASSNKVTLRAKEGAPQSITRYVKKTVLWIPVGNTHNGAGMGEDFTPIGNGDENFKYTHVKRGRGGDHYLHTRRYSI